jgi:hypothetical protein
MTSSTSNEQPLLIGLLIDVSASMQKQLYNKSGDTLSRLESIKNSLDDLIIHARTFYDDAEKTGRQFDLFALGFGFGNLRDTLLSLIVSKELATVRSLLTNDSDSLIVKGSLLLDDWTRYRRSIQDLGRSMGGATPLAEALRKAEELFAMALASGQYGDPSVMLIVSDGLPTDPVEAPDTGPGMVRDSCQRLRASGIIVVSCFVTSTDSAEYKKLYRQPLDCWDEGAKLMFDCASTLASDSPFRPHLREYEWDAEDGARLFAQINQSELLTEFVRIAIAPLRNADAVSTADTVNVFVSYCHYDAKYVAAKGDSLLSFVQGGLEDEHLKFWVDLTITAGDLWDENIRRSLERADIALVLVSQAFLNSSYCMTVEAPSFIQSRVNRGLRIIPVLLSACDWKKHKWLASTQAIPRDGKTVETHFSGPAKRKELFLQVLEQIRRNAEVVRKQRMKH